MSDFRVSGEDGVWREGQAPTTRRSARTGQPVAERVPTFAPIPTPATAPRIEQPDASSGAAAPQPTKPLTMPPRRSLVRRALRLSFRIGLALAFLFAGLILLYRFVNPPLSALMLLQRASGEAMTRTWVPIERISPHLVRAVIMSEDAGFCRHHGIDIGELKAAIDNAQDGVVRGGSTISMQTAKNLFLWPARSYVRKAIEIPLTLGMEAVWSKTRLLEIYLNIVEWGPGIFGAEAAARYHFNKPASRLNEQEAALLAVTLPAPLIREPGRPSVLLQRMGRTIEQRMKSATRHASCVLGAAKP